jgi:Yip1 domain
MNEATAAPASDPGLFARAVGILFSPRATFEKVVQNPKPVGILFLSAAIIALSAGLPQFTEAGRQAALDMQVKQQEQFTKQPVTPQQYARMEQMSHYGAYFGIGFTFIIMPVMSLIFAGLFFVAFNAILGGTASFKQVLAVQTHSSVVPALGAAIGAPIQLMQGVVSMAGPFNLGALVTFMDEGSRIRTILGSISVFSIWGLIATAIGLGVLYRRNSRNIAVTLILLYVLIVGGLVMMFSRGASAG